MQNPHLEPARPRRGRAPALSPEDLDARRLVQELQLCRIELEMQNDELQRAQEESRATRAELDRQVVARTSELTRTIEGLSAEVQLRCRAEQSLASAFTELESARNRLRAENTYVHQQMDLDQGERLIGPSAAMDRLKSQLDAAAALETPVLLLGEAGTGKGVAARAIHDRSPRRHRPMVTLSCAVLPPELLDGVLFGRAKGVHPQLGQIDVADQGTLFLDEICALPLDLQARLLHAVREPGRAARIIAASIHHLGDEVREGRFLEDLRACLEPAAIALPPLRERREDIPALVAAFLAQSNRTYGKRITTVSERTLDLLTARPWPGNVMELKHVVELAVISSQGSTLEV